MLHQLGLELARAAGRAPARSSRPPAGRRGRPSARASAAGPRRGPRARPPSRGSGRRPALRGRLRIMREEDLLLLREVAQHGLVHRLEVRPRARAGSSAFSAWTSSTFAASATSCGQLLAQSPVVVPLDVVDQLRQRALVPARQGRLRLLAVDLEQHRVGVEAALRAGLAQTGARRDSRSRDRGGETRARRPGRTTARSASVTSADCVDMFFVLPGASGPQTVRARALPPNSAVVIQRLTHSCYDCNNGPRVMKEATPLSKSQRPPGRRTRTSPPRSPRCWTSRVTSPLRSPARTGTHGCSRRFAAPSRTTRPACCGSRARCSCPSRPTGSPRLRSAAASTGASTRGSTSSCARRSRSASRPTARLRTRSKG